MTYNEARNKVNKLNPLLMDVPLNDEEYDILLSYIKALEAAMDYDEQHPEKNFLKLFI